MYVCMYVFMYVCMYIVYSMYVYHHTIYAIPSTSVKRRQYILKRLPSTKCLNHCHPMLHDVLSWNASLNKSRISHCCKNLVFWCIRPCSLVDIYWGVEKSSRFHLLPWGSKTYLRVLESWDSKLLLIPEVFGLLQFKVHCAVCCL